MRADGICRSCRAPIAWTITAAKGRRMPLDPEPSETGNVMVATSTLPHVSTVLNAEEVAHARTLGTELYTSHHATCPQGKQWKNRQRRRK